MNIKRFRVFLITLLYLLNDSTGCKNPNNGSDNVSADQPYFVVVLCDVSPSVSRVNSKDSANYQQKIIDGMVKSCTDILRHYPPNSVINYYFISSNSQALPFLTYNSPEVLQTNAAEIKDGLLLLDSILHKRIDSAARNTENCTCLLTSIENAYRAFATYQQNVTEVHKNELIIFSDMVEECPKSPVGHIMMSSDQNKEFLIAEEKRKITLYKPNVNFGSVQANIIIGITTPKMDSKVFSSLDEIWRVIFTNYGYQRATDSSLLLLQSSPVFTRRLDYN